MESHISLHFIFSKAGCDNTPQHHKFKQTRTNPEATDAWTALPGKYYLPVTMPFSVNHRVFCHIPPSCSPPLSGGSFYPHFPHWKGTSSLIWKHFFAILLSSSCFCFALEHMSAALSHCGFSILHYSLSPFHCARPCLTIYNKNA